MVRDKYYMNRNAVGTPVVRSVSNSDPGYDDKEATRLLVKISTKRTDRHGSLRLPPKKVSQSIDKSGTLTRLVRPEPRFSAYASRMQYAGFRKAADKGRSHLDQLLKAAKV